MTPKEFYDKRKLHMTNSPTIHLEIKPSERILIHDKFDLDYISVKLIEGVLTADHYRKNHHSLEKVEIKPTIETLRLGQPLSCTKIFRREGYGTAQKFQKVWTEFSVPEFTGIYIGYRYKQNGYTDDYEWITKGIQLTLLVATHPKRTPVYVPINAVSVLPQSIECFRQG